MPLANAFPSSPAEFVGERRYPLAVTACGVCGLVQLTHVVPAEQLYRDYIYVSSTSEAVALHAERLAEHLIHRYGWRSDSLIVEVASNDGTVLKAFKRRGVRVLGVEPARNIARIAEEEGVPTVAEFFHEAMAGTIRAEHGEAAAIVGRHVFAHVDDVHDFLRGVRRLLAPDGVLVVEVPYLGDLLDKLEFDTVYHEHLSYFSLAPIRRLAAQHELELVDVERIALHGGSMILYLRRASASEPLSARLDVMWRDEQARRLGDPATLDAFAAAVARWKEEFQAFVSRLVRPGVRLAGYGAAAKANTLLNYCPEVASRLTAILDRSPHKHGRHTPGTHLRVVPADHWQRDGTTHLLILAWNFKDEIMRQLHPFAAAGGRFVIPIPKPEVV